MIYLPLQSKCYNNNNNNLLLKRYLLGHLMTILNCTGVIENHPFNKKNLIMSQGESPLEPDMSSLVKAVTRINAAP